MFTDKKIGPSSYFAMIVVILTIVYFAIPTGSIQTLSFSKPESKRAQQITVTPHRAAAMQTVTSDIEAADPKGFVGPVQTTPPVSLGFALKVPVLMYHHVGDMAEEERAKDPIGSDLTVSPADFEAQVKYFHDLGYSSITVAQLYEAVSSKTKLPGKPIIFTFDDGYADVFANAVPILQKYGYTGSFAIATELLGRPSYAQWSDVIAADKTGMEILSHTENHLDLTSSVYSEDDLHREIFGAKQKLETQLGHPVDYFVYPYGRVNTQVAALVSQAGYKMAFTTAYGLYQAEGRIYTEPRVRVHGVDGLAKLEKIFSPEPAPRTATVQTNP